MRSASQAVSTLIIFSLAGIGISLFSFFHYTGAVDGAVCVIGQSFDCDVVNQGAYSVFYGIPVSVIGLIGYAFLLIAGLALFFRPDDFSMKRFLLLSSGLGLLFSLYLTGIEAYVLYTWCIVCVTSLALIVSIFAMSVFILRK